MPRCPQARENANILPHLTRGDSWGRRRRKAVDRERHLGEKGVGRQMDSGTFECQKSGTGVEFEMGRELGVKNEGRREKEARECFYLFTF